MRGLDCIANEQSSETWYLNTLKLIKAIEDKKSIPILVTGAPRPGYDKVIGLFLARSCSSIRIRTSRSS